ncbi:hypothetical protein HOA59_03665 [archaeon]|jgi:hypothetical protein|nr:hypothetical protein [archaeon]MBT6824493.1 hypothetical protein [archaeon]MBT7106948.1 hypothetical protein [archaeon]MBT7297839.1 hypothetical protein [archaeon]
MVTDNIQILGMEGFDEKEREKILSYSENYHKKIKRDIPCKLVLHAKKHDKVGGRCMYSFHAKVQLPDHLVNVEDGDWILSTALHKVLKKVENNIKHKVRNH